jgi:hypothetical protein
MIGFIIGTILGAIFTIALELFMAWLLVFKKD